MHTILRPSRLLDLTLLPRLSRPESVRLLSTSCPLLSGHSRWSKIKHDKAKVDMGRTKVRSQIAASIRNAVKTGGSDAATNQRLAAALAEAKKNDLPKTVVERAIARGQGISLSGAPLEAFTVEFMRPPSIAGILEVETDNRNRTLQDIRAIFKNHGATPTPCAYMFDRRGKVVINADGVRTEEQVLDAAIEAGALDVETDEEDGFVVWTEPEEMTSVADALDTSLGTTPTSIDLVYVAKDDAKAEVEEEGDDVPPSQRFETLISKLEEHHEVQEIYLNTS